MPGKADGAEARRRSHANTPEGILSADCCSRHGCAMTICLRAAGSCEIAHGVGVVVDEVIRVSPCDVDEVAMCVLNAVVYDRDLNPISRHAEPIPRSDNVQPLRTEVPGRTVQVALFQGADVERSAGPQGCRHQHAGQHLPWPASQGGEERERILRGSSGS